LKPRICAAEVFLFCKVKREDLFELLCKHNNEFRNARSKTKIQGLSQRDGTIYAASSLLSFLLAQERKSLKSLGL
jgi:hypothetical protein